MPNIFDIDKVVHMEVPEYTSMTKFNAKITLNDGTQFNVITDFEEVNEVYKKLCPRTPSKYRRQLKKRR